MIPPDQFIPLAEETGLIVPIGRWVLREGLPPRAPDAGRAPGREALTMSINLSVKQLQHSDVIADVHDAVQEAVARTVGADARDHETVLRPTTTYVCGSAS